MVDKIAGEELDELVGRLFGAWTILMTYICWAYFGGAFSIMTQELIDTNPN